MGKLSLVRPARLPSHDQLAISHPRAVLLARVLAVYMLPNLRSSIQGVRLLAISAVPYGTMNICCVYGSFALSPGL